MTTTTRTNRGAAVTTTYTTTTGDRPAETPWPIDRFSASNRQRVLIKAEVYDDPDPEDDDPDTRYYTFSIDCGDGRTELVSIRESHIRAIVHRIEE